MVARPCQRRRERLTRFDEAWVGLFYERLRQVVLTRPEAGRILAGDNEHCNHGLGPFDTALRETCYCTCQAPMHYASFQDALDDAGVTGQLPLRPLVVDLGCGPSTALFALCDKLHDRRRAPINVGYLAIDAERRLLATSTALVRGCGLFDAASQYVWSTTVDDVRPADVERVVAGRDGVVFALSYIVHQPFMQGMGILADLMRVVKLATPALPAWFLLQDANFAERPAPHTEIWPESRVNQLANLVAPVGYTVRSYKRKFPARRIRLSVGGKVEAHPAGTTDNACHFFQQIA